MSITPSLWNQSKPVYDAILAHPFNRELATGTLARDRFAYYVQQDSLYLRDYARALAQLAARAPDAAAAEDLLGYAKGGMEVERALHQHFFTQFNIAHTDVMEPACFAYTQFLLARTALDDFAVGLAAVLPCFWIYREVGLHIAAHAVPANPYAPWIATYSDASFGVAVRRMLELTDAAAAGASPALRDAMHAAYAASTRCEWCFWDAAHRLERWPV
ncbi:MAG TPA: TenA family protein [Kiritimatiellia bacterium]|nr:TenA family protein [Kiritimatiellia bacterium]